MNKTININLGGFFFHIDEVAYEKLKRYLDAISRSLSDDPQGKNEIIADIESRISELLSEKIADARQVVNEGDIDDIIKIMGQPEDYADTEETTYSSSSYSYSRNSSKTKKLFRDGDDKFLGGVASGIAHYFDVDAIWIRLGMLALFFGAGFGFLIYIILWILLPEAKTTAEKLQMEGTPVNIDNIEKKIREEYNNVSENVKDLANKASENIKKGAEDLKKGANEFSDKMSKTFSGKPKKNNGVSDFFDVIGKIILTLFKVFGKFIGVIIIIVAAAVILSLIIGGFSIIAFEGIHIDGDYVQYPPFFYGSTLPIWLNFVLVFLLVGIPFLLLFILGLRILSSSVQKMNKTTSLSLFGIWVVALLGLIFTGLEFAGSHSTYGKSTEKIELNTVANDTLNVKMINNDDIYFRSLLKNSYYKVEVEVEGKTQLYSSDINVDVRKSEDNTAYFIVKKESKGKNRRDANRNAESVKYNFKIEDNTLILDAYFLTKYRNMWKDEEVDIIIYLPENANIYFDNTTKYFLNNVDNETDIYDRDMANHYFIMTDETLSCTDCEEIEEKVEENDKKAVKTEVIKKENNETKTDSLNIEKII